MPAVRKMTRERLSKIMGYKPHAAQLPVHAAVEKGTRYIGINAGTRSGKTRMISTEIITELAFPPPKGGHLRLIQIVAPIMDLTDKAFEWVWDAVVVKNCMGVQPVSRSRHERYIQMPWGSRVEGKTAEEPKQLLGDGLCMVVCDEFSRFPEGIFEQYLERAMMDWGGQMICITTPNGRNNHWFKKFTDWTDRMLRGEEDYFTTQFGSRDNPYLKPGEVDRLERKFREMGLVEVYYQEYEAAFTSLSGMIYPMFMPQKDGKPWHVDQVNPQIFEKFTLV